VFYLETGGRDSTLLNKMDCHLEIEQKVVFFSVAALSCCGHTLLAQKEAKLFPS
jgi:hypothetical protein